MMKKLLHVGIAVKELHRSAETFEKLFGQPASHTETVTDQKVKIAFFHLGNVSIELTEAISPESAIAKFVEKRGEGIHHLSFEVEDIDEELRRLTKSGFLPVDEKPRQGADGYRVAFLHPKSTNGVLIELSQKR